MSIIRFLNVPFTSQPQEAVTLAPEFSQGLDVWLPGDTGLIKISNSDNYITTNNTEVSFVSRTLGKEIIKTNAGFTPGITITPRPGATKEMWLAVIGSTITNTSTGNTCTIGDTTNHGILIDQTQTALRTASATHIVKPPATPGEAVAWHNVNSDHRLYFRNEKTVSTLGYGTYFAINGLSLTNQSFALLARWTNYAPSDDQIFRLLQNPWQLFTNSISTIVVVPNSVPFLSNFIIINPTQATARPRVTLTF